MGASSDNGIGRVTDIPVADTDRIDVLKASPTSLMPEKILDALDDQQICDLFSYLQGDGEK